MTEQFSSMEHDVFHVSYLSDKIPEAVSTAFHRFSVLPPGPPRPGPHPALVLVGVRGSGVSLAELVFALVSESALSVHLLTGRLALVCWHDLRTVRRLSG